MSMKTAAIYARVSSDQQKEDKTIGSQTAALVAFASSHGYGVPDEWIFEDEGFSGATLVRPGLERVRDLVAEGQVQAVLVLSPDRLSRKYAYQVLLTEEWLRQGVETIFVNAPQSHSPEDQLLLQFQGMIAEYERAQILERSRRGKRHRAKQGEASVLSAAPYGYRYVRKTEDRAAYFGDPDVCPIPIDRLLSEEAAREKAARIHKGSVVRFGGSTSPSPPHTANIVVADADGNVVSVTATQGYLYGSTVVIEGLGLVMGHGMSRFDLSDGSPNAPAAGKRMFHNMAPMVLLGPSARPWAAVGLPGGPKIVTVTAQLVVSLVDFKVAPNVAVSAPRVHVEADEPIAASATVPERVIEELRAIGHTVSRGQNVGGLPDEIGGKANAIVIDPATQDVLAASQAGEAAAMTIEITR